MQRHEADDQEEGGVDHETDEEWESAVVSGGRQAIRSFLSA